MDKTIKHLQFWYHTKRHDAMTDQDVTVEQVAYQGDTVDVTSKADLARGEREGAFYTDAELAAFAGEAPETEASDEPIPVPDLATASTDDVADWMDDQTPTINDLLEMVNGSSDPDAAAKTVLEAENLARSGDSRKGLVEGMTAILERNAE